MLKEEDYKTLTRILTAYKKCVDILRKSADYEAERGIHTKELAPFRSKKGVGKDGNT